MCSTPKTHPKPLPARRYQGMSADALRRFTEIANAADERREQRQKNRAKQQVSVKNITPEGSIVDQLLEGW